MRGMQRYEDSLVGVHYVKRISDRANYLRSLSGQAQKVFVRCSTLQGDCKACDQDQATELRPAVVPGRVIIIICATYVVWDTCTDGRYGTIIVIIRGGTEPDAISEGFPLHMQDSAKYHQAIKVHAHLRQAGGSCFTYP